MFEDPEIFHFPVAFRQNKKQTEPHPDLYVWAQDLVPCSYNIFSILQILAPGMLVIEHKYQRYDTYITVFRVLPTAFWIGNSYGAIDIKLTGGWEGLFLSSINQKTAFLDVGREPLNSGIDRTFI